MYKSVCDDVNYCNIKRETGREEKVRAKPKYRLLLREKHLGGEFKLADDNLRG